MTGISTAWPRLVNKPRLDGLTENRQQALAGLLHLLTYGEQIATQCAAWQASNARDKRTAGFFNAQRKHEQFHAQLFHRAAGWLDPKSSTPEQGLHPLSAYRDRLVFAIRHKRWLEVIVGQQLVLEGIGEVVLSSLDECMAQHNIGFKRLRRMILNQEHAHHSFGLNLLNEAIDCQSTDATELNELAMPYLELTQRLFCDIAPALQELDIDAAEYGRELWFGMPSWVNRMPA